MSPVEVIPLVASRRQNKAQVGFTLVEVLMALSISALVAVLAYGSVSAATNAVTSTRLQAEQLDHLDTTWQLLARDLQQVVAVPIEQSSAQRQLPKLALGEMPGETLGLMGAVTPDLVDAAAGRALTVLRFVRRGWQNPLQRQRSHLQLVIYEWYQGNLYRRHEPFYEGMALAHVAMDPVTTKTVSNTARLATIDNPLSYSRRRLLLRDVDSITLQFLPSSASHLGIDQWKDTWPPAEDSSALPVALKLGLIQRETFAVQRWFDIPAGFVR